MSRKTTAIDGPKPKFMSLGSSKYIHTVRTKTWDLKNSQCLQVRKYQVADKIKGKGISPEAASVLEPCLSCDTAAAIRSVTPKSAKAEERKAKRDDVIEKIRAEQKPVGKKSKAKSGDKPIKTPKPKATKVGVRSTGSGERDKATQLMDFAKEHGWKPSIGDGEPGLLVTLKKGDQTILCWYIDGKYDIARHAKIVVGSWEGKLRGAHQCRRQIAGEGRDKPYPNPGQGRSGPRHKSEEDEPPPDESPEDAARRVPFTMEDDDIAIIDAIKGRTIKWRNTLNNTIESAWVPASPEGKKTPKIYMQAHPKTGERMVTFMTVMSVNEHGEVYGATRTVSLGKIIRVVN